MVPRFTAHSWVFWGLTFVSLVGCGDPPPIEGLDRDRVELSPPRHDSSFSLEKALHSRRSFRDFKDTPLQENEISQIMWAAQGITDSKGLRTAPSAGRLYPLDLFVTMKEGLFQYDPSVHALNKISEIDGRSDLHDASSNQRALIQAPAVFILGGRYVATAAKYGVLEAPKFVHLEAGHVTQNLLLQVAALGLGAVPVGGFESDRIRTLLDLDPEWVPIYLIAVGHPK